MSSFTNSLTLIIFLVCLSTTLSISLVKSCNPIDKEALLNFKLRITNDPSGLLDSWSLATDCCTAWEGVTCDNGRVVNVSRTSAEYYNSGDLEMSIDDTIFMSGTLSPFLGNLTYLQVLDFTALQNLTGPIPTELGKLSNLTSLHLDINKLTGSIPGSFGDFPKLKHLTLASNNLTGIIPQQIFQSSISMLKLDLSENQLSGPLPSSIGKLTSLTKLRLNNNLLSGVIPNSIGNLKSLKELVLSKNTISRSIPPSIGELTSLRDLKLDDNKLTGDLPDSIGNLPKIETINLMNNMITGNIPSSLGNLSTIQTLKLSNNRFIGQIPSSFGNLKHLGTLELMRNQLVGPIPPNLAQLTIRNLALSYNPLELGEIPNWLLKSKTLAGLALANTGIKGELPVFPLSIYILDLSSNELIGKLPSWLGNMHNLSKLNLSNNGFNSTIPEELCNLELLESVSLSSNNLYGSIPGKLMSLYFLEAFDVSKNRLTGKIPPHKADLPAAGFMGNPGLCDAPLPPCKLV